MLTDRFFSEEKPFWNWDVGVVKTPRSGPVGGMAVRRGDRGGVAVLQAPERLRGGGDPCGLLPLGADFQVLGRVSAVPLVCQMKNLISSLFSVSISVACFSLRLFPALQFIRIVRNLPVKEERSQTTGNVLKG